MLEEHYDNWNIPKTAAQENEEAGKGKPRDEKALNHLRAALIFSEDYEKEQEEKEIKRKEMAKLAEENKEAALAAEIFNTQAKERVPEKKDPAAQELELGKFKEQFQKATNMPCDPKWEDKTACSNCGSYWQAWQDIGLRDLGSDEKKDPTIKYYKWKGCEPCDDWWCPECRNETWIHQEHQQECHAAASLKKAKKSATSTSSQQPAHVRTDVTPRVVECLNTDALKNQLRLRHYPLHGTKEYLKLRLLFALQLENKVNAPQSLRSGVLQVPQEQQSRSSTSFTVGAKRKDSPSSSSGSENSSNVNQPVRKSGRKSSPKRGKKAKS